MINSLGLGKGMVRMVSLMIMGFLIPVSSYSQNWTHFRGSNLNGISDDGNVPVHWNDTSNIRWKTPLHGKGWSSPVIYGNQVWMTTAEEDGSAIYAVCMEKNTGAVIFDIKLAEPDSVFAKHTLNSFATPTPCIESEYVYLHFGNYGTFCLRTSDASLVWKRTDLTCDYVQGPASSPILYRNLLILHFEGVDVQYIVAVDKTNGSTVWRTDRPKDCYDLLEPIGKKAYITPLIIRVNGKDMLISNGAAACIAYDPETGAEIWRIVHGEDSTITMPVFENGIVYFYSSFITPPGGDKYAELFAVNPAGKGNIKETNVLWRYQTPVLQLLTPLIKDGLIYTIDTRSNLVCLDARTGATIWSKRMKGIFNSSPVYAGGKIYFSTTKGNTIVIKEGRNPVFLADNMLEGEIWATPAIADQSLFIRTSKYLYRISE